MHNLDDVKELLYEIQPRLFCVQETHLKSTQTSFLKQYSIFRKDREDGLAASGGVAIIAQRSVACQHLRLQTNLEAVAIRAILFDRLVTVCSLYVPPDFRLELREFEKLIDQLPEPYILTGDLNAHNTLWGDPRCDARGRVIENFLLCSGAVLLNKKDPTFYSTTHHSYSSIDLTISSAAMMPYLDWRVIKNPYGSDHFPIVLNLTKQVEYTPHIPRWKLDKADWECFRKCTHLKRDDIAASSIDDAVAFFTAFIIDAASKSIPQTNGFSNKRRVPWWNEECRKARKNQNKAWGLLRESPTVDNLINFKRIKSQGRRTRRQAKRESWEKYLTGINSYTDEKKAWDRVRKIKGRQTHTMPLVNNQGNSIEDQANSLGAHFELVSSSAHYSQTFLRHKEIIERKPLERKCTPTEGYNSFFSMPELRAALISCNQSAPGPDRISYEMIQHVHPEALITLLSLFNAIWEAGYVPSSWREAIVIPILKEGKEPSLASSYRPIALTSCLCKLLEKMINRRLIHYLETNKLLDPY